MDQLSNTFDLGLTSEFIDKITKKICDRYYGIFPCDYLEAEFSLLQKKHHFSLIANLSPSTMLGDHFITIIRKREKIFYFDSFGKDCTNLNILNFMKKFELPVYFNSIKIQSVQSNFCGFFCIYTCLKYDDEENEIQEKWFVEENDLLKNDKLCINLIKKYGRK